VSHRFLIYANGRACRRLGRFTLMRADARRGAMRERPYRRNAARIDAPN
jgi:hypothetical protein